MGRFEFRNSLLLFLKLQRFITLQVMEQIDFRDRKTLDKMTNRKEYI